MTTKYKQETECTKQQMQSFIFKVYLVRADSFVK